MYQFFTVNGYEESHYIGCCSFCGDGLLRFQRCQVCDQIVAKCDECEFMWEDIASLSDDSNSSSDSKYPRCPFCGERKSEFSNVTIEELEENGLAEYSSGETV